MFFCLIVRKMISSIPKSFDEGSFDFFTREQIDNLNIPKSDHELVWPFFDSRNKGFWGIRADCSNSEKINIKIESFPL